jgi:hypothetical protein
MATAGEPRGRRCVVRTVPHSLTQPAPVNAAWSSSSCTHTDTPSHHTSSGRIGHRHTRNRHDHQPGQPMWSER